MITWLVAASVFIGYFLESIFGFGGTILSVSMMSLFIDFKEAIKIVMLVSFLASVLILASDHKSFSWKHFGRIMVISVPGTILGTWLFAYLSSFWLLKIFGGFLIAFSLQSLFLPKVTLPKLLRYPFIFAGGILQGLYGTGGPATLLGYRDDFEGKSQLRTVMAAYFMVGNAVRIIQLYIQGKLDTEVVLGNWWLFFPLVIAVFAGHRIHVAINEDTFKKGVSILLLVAGISFLLK